MLERVPDARLSWRPHEKSRDEVVRTLMLNHGYHHRGQLTVYLRLLDVALPPVYGPTADESPFGRVAAPARLPAADERRRGDIGQSVSS